MSLKKSFLSGVFSGGIGFFLKTALMLILTPWMIALLGTQRYGAYLLFVSFSEMAMILASGFTTGFVQQLSHAIGQEDEQRQLQLLIDARWMYLVLTGLTVLAGLWVLPVILGMLFRSSPLTWLEILQTGQWVVGYCGILILSRYLYAVLRSHCMQESANWIESFQNMGESALALIMILGGFGLPGVFMGRCLLSVFVGMILSLIVIRHEKQWWESFRHWHLEFGETRRLFGMSVYASIQNVSVFIAHRMDEVVIACFLTLADVTCFGLVMRMIGQISALNIKIMEGLFPLFSRFSGQNDQARSRHLFLRSTATLHYMVSLLLILFIGGFPEFLAYMSHGTASLAQAYPIVWIAGALTWSGCIQIPASNYLFSSGKHRFQTISTAITALCNLALSLFLIRKIGLPGVILGSLIPHGIQHHLVTIHTTLRELRLKWGAFLYDTYVKTFPSILIAGILTVLLRQFAPTGPYGLLIGLFFIAIISMASWIQLCLEAEERHFLFTRLSLLFEKIWNTAYISHRLQKPS